MGTSTTKTDTTTDASTTDAAEEQAAPVQQDEAPTASGDDTAKDGVPAQAAAADEDAEDAAEPRTEEEAADEDAAPVRANRGIAAGAGAVVGAALGLASLTGTWAGTILAERQTVLGQIKLQTGKTSDQIAAVYTTPWHTTALVNGVFALLALVTTAVVLVRRPQATWVKAVAWGGFALSVIGLVVAGGMYLDLFASAPKLSAGGS